MILICAEMHELYDMPSADSITRGDHLNGRGEGVTGVYSGNRVIRMFPGALIALLEVHDGVHGCCGFVCRHTTIAEQSDVRR